MSRQRAMRSVLGALSLAGLLTLVGCGQQQAPVSPSPVAAAPKAPSKEPPRPVSTPKAEEHRSLPVNKEPPVKEPPPKKVVEAIVPTPPASEPDPRHQTLMDLHAMIRPRTGEAIWSEIPWMTDLWEARKKAAAEGKPIFLWTAQADPIGCT